MNLTFGEVKVGDRFRLRYPLERGDGIEFPENTIFEVVCISQHPYGAKTWHSFRLHRDEEGYHWKGLAVPIPSLTNRIICTILMFGLRR